jgi:F0F1-type ATP synthase assembly protein I
MPERKSDHYDFTHGKPAIRRDADPIRGKQLANQGRVWAIGMNFAFMVMGGGLLGWVIQYFAGGAPWPLLIGLGAGMLAGLLQFIREAMKLNKS